MTKTFAPLQALLLAALLAAPLAHIRAQTAPAPDPLFKTIQSLDTQLFDAYNHCDLEKFGSLLADDLEFYHDKTGLSRGRPALVEGIKNNICGKVTRELVPGTLEVYPIANYGAVEIGIHRFHHPGHEDATGVGEAKFIQFWQNKDGSWISLMTYCLAVSCSRLFPCPNKTKKGPQRAVTPSRSSVSFSLASASKVAQAGSAIAWLKQCPDTKILRSFVPPGRAGDPSLHGLC